MNNYFYKGLTGKIITPFDNEYNIDRQVWNRAIQKFPFIIVYCYSKEDISNAICWSRNKNIGIRIRNGGHNYAGYSTGNGILLIDISYFNKIQMDTIKNELILEGGVKNSQIYDFVGSIGYPFPSGTCPTVGAAGLVQGGGWGLSSRTFGLACDSLLEIELINYNGNTITANEYLNSDLFWACRGAGGGNFGIVTHMRFKLPEKVNGVCLIKLNCELVTSKKIYQFIKTWQNWLENLDIRMNMVSRIRNVKVEGLQISGTGFFYGTVQEANAILEPFNRIDGMNISIESLSFFDAIQKVQDVYPKYDKFQSTGRFVYRKYNQNEICNIVNIVLNKPIGATMSGFSLYSLGGKVSDVNKNDTAFYYRDAKYILLIEVEWENNSFQIENKIWLDQNFKYIYSITKGSYVNFPYSKLKNYELNYYGKNMISLRNIKKRYDPYNVFKFP